MLLPRLARVEEVADAGVPQVVEEHRVWHYIVVLQVLTLHVLDPYYNAGADELELLLLKYLLLHKVPQGFGHNLLDIVQVVFILKGEPKVDDEGAVHLLLIAELVHNLPPQVLRLELVLLPDLHGVLLPGHTVPNVLDGGQPVLHYKPEHPEPLFVNIYLIHSAYSRTPPFLSSPAASTPSPKCPCTPPSPPSPILATL